MHNTIDLIVIVLVLYYLYRGWTKGFVGSLIGPISLLLGAGISYMYFRQSHNMMVAGIISFFCPILIHVTLSVVTNVSTYGHRKPEPSVISSLFGAVISLGWSGGILVLLMLMINVLPPQLPSIAAIQERLALTKSYQLVNHVTGSFSIYSSMPIQTFMAVLENPEQLAAVQSSAEYQSFVNDDRIKALMSDPEIQSAVEDRNIGKMLADKRMIDLLQDEDLLSKIFAVQGLIIQQGSNPEGFVPDRTVVPRATTRPAVQSKSGPYDEKAPKKSGPLVIEID